ncbi:MAG: FmdB family zinc ribbon protein [Puniceicoccales bacterium]
MPLSIGSEQLAPLQARDCNSGASCHAHTIMPIYEYHCPDCNHDAELLVRSSDEKPVCPDCGSAKLEKQFSTFAAGGAPAPSMSSCCSGGGCGCGPSAGRN